MCSLYRAQSLSTSTAAEMAFSEEVAASSASSLKKSPSSVLIDALELRSHDCGFTSQKMVFVQVEENKD